MRAPLTDVTAEVRAAHPDFAVSEETFAAFLRERPGADAAHARDLYVACACAEGDARAIALFEREHLAPLAAVLARAGFPSHVGGEIVQALRVRLLVAEGAAPSRIRAYEGRAPLAAWLRVVALREAATLHRREGVHARLRPDPPPPPISPEEAAVRAKYGALFEKAFAEAFRALGSDERLALRLHFVDRLNLDALAVTFGCSRATAGRRLLLARTRLRDETLRLVGEELDASTTEVASVLAALRSSLEVSFGALVTQV